MHLLITLLPLWIRDDVLQALAKTWHTLTTATFPMKSDAEKKLATVVKSLEGTKSRRQSQESVSWQRIAALYQFMDLNGHFWERLLTAVVSSAGGQAADVSVVPYVAKCGFYGMQAVLASIHASCARTHEATQTHRPIRAPHAPSLSSP